MLLGVPETLTPNLFRCVEIKHKTTRVFSFYSGSVYGLFSDDALLWAALCYRLGNQHWIAKTEGIFHVNFFWYPTHLFHLQKNQRGLLLAGWSIILDCCFALGKVKMHFWSAKALILYPGSQLQKDPRFSFKISLPVTSTSSSINPSPLLPLRLSNQLCSLSLSELWLPLKQLFSLTCHTISTRVPLPQTNSELDFWAHGQHVKFKHLAE